MTHLTRILFALLVVTGLVWPVAAQVPPVVDLAGVEFLPSPDHDAVTDGVVRYRLDLATPTTPPTVAQTIDLGKPPIVAGKITVAFPAAVTSLAPGTYVAIVTAEGLRGASASLPSDPFTVGPADPGCTGTIGVFVTGFTETTKRAGSQMLITYQLSSVSPIVRTQVKVDGLVVQDSGLGANVRLQAYGSMWFTAPPIGTHTAALVATNADGCTREAASPVPLRIRQ
jgi:hypothetical protein